MEKLATFSRFLEGYMLVVCGGGTLILYCVERNIKSGIIGSIERL